PVVGVGSEPGDLRARHHRPEGLPELADRGLLAEFDLNDRAAREVDAVVQPRPLVELPEEGGKYREHNRRAARGVRRAAMPDEIEVRVREESHADPDSASNADGFHRPLPL